MRTGSVIHKREVDVHAGTAGVGDRFWHEGQNDPAVIGHFAGHQAEKYDVVHRFDGIIEGLGMQVATPDEARQILSLKGGDKVAF